MLLQYAIESLSQGSKTALVSSIFLLWKYRNRITHEIAFR